jgi:pyruvate dehydrogenase E1 component alpha subunit
MTIASTQIPAPADSTQPHNGFSLISNEKLLELYSTMLKCRLLEQTLAEPLPVAASHDGAKRTAVIKQEAAVAGVCADLLPGDTLAPSHRGLMQCFAKGLPLNQVVSLSPAGVRVRSPYTSFNLIAPRFSLAVQLERAIEAAIANKKSRNKKIAVAFCGLASDSPDVLHQAMLQIGKRKLPMLLVCHSHSETDEIFAQAKECGFPGVIVDGDDAVAVYRVATEAIAHARRGSRPTLIECKPWPLADAQPGRRRKRTDPISNMETYLTRKGLFDKKFKSAVTTAFRRELNAVIHATTPS